MVQDMTIPRLVLAFAAAASLAVPALASASTSNVTAVRAVATRFVVDEYHGNAADACKLMTPRLQAAFVKITVTAGAKGITGCPKAFGLLLQSGGAQSMTLAQAEHALIATPIQIHGTTATMNSSKTTILVKVGTHWLFSKFGGVG